MQLRNRYRNIGITVATFAAVIAIVWLYGRIDPSDPVLGRFFPKCIFKQLTGLQCPACGLQRAFHELINGNFMGAWRCNWFIIFSLAYLGAVIGSRLWLKPESKLRRFFSGQKGGYIYVGLYFIWLFVRNYYKI